jgi:hypothetical protein
LEENVGAANVKIAPEEDKEIRKIIAECGVHGERYAPGGMASVGK